MNINLIHVYFRRSQADFELEKQETRMLLEEEKAKAEHTARKAQEMIKVVFIRVFLSSWCLIVYVIYNLYWIQVTVNSLFFAKHFVLQLTVDSLIFAIWVHLMFAMFNFTNVTSGVLFSYASIIFRNLYFRDSKEPCKTHIIKESQKLRNLQYSLPRKLKVCHGWRAKLFFVFTYDLDRSITHPNFNMSKVRTHDLQIMTVDFMSLRCLL